MLQVSRGSAHLPMQYQVLARKWRPESFEELVGQPHVSRTLTNALKTGRLAHAFLFSGPRGSGKTTTARILAKALDCQEGKVAEPCGKCAACLEIAAGTCIDVLEIDAASNRGIDEIRDLREKVRYNPARDPYKIFIIDEVHMLTPEAFNALLKTLEEPPGHVVFILATTEYHKIPATILSRCQQYSFKLIAFDLILGRLQQIAKAEKIEISVPALEQIAFSSGGSMRDAMSAFDQVIAFSGSTVRDEDVPMLLGLVAPKLLHDVAQAIANHDTQKILSMVSGLVEEGHDLQNFCESLLGRLRNLMVVKTGVSEVSILGIPQSLVPELEKQAELFSREDLIRIFDALLKVRTELKYSVNARFQLEMGLIEVSQIARMRALEDLIADFASLVQGTAAPGNPSGGSGMKDAGHRPLPSPGSGGDRSATRGPARAGDAGDSFTEDRPAQGRIHHEFSARATPSPDLLMEKALGLIEKQSLVSILKEIPVKKINGDTVTLNLADTNGFYQKQIRENLPLISEATSRVAGRRIRVELHVGDREADSAANQEPQQLASDDDVLARAKREPVVQSFLDMFPGHLRAEDLE